MALWSMTKNTKICKLDKFMYGLQQSPKKQCEKIDNLTISNEFKK